MFVEIQRGAWRKRIKDKKRYKKKINIVPTYISINGHGCIFQHFQTVRLNFFFLLKNLIPYSTVFLFSQENNN